MKKAILLILISGNILCFYTIQLFATNGNFQLKTSTATLIIDKKGNLKILHNSGQKIMVHTSIYNLWQICLKNTINNEEFHFMPDKSVTIIEDDSIIRLSVNRFHLKNNSLPITAEFNISVKDDSFCFSGFLKSYSDEWIIKELSYPIITQIEVDNADASIYWPRGLGQHFRDPASFGSQSLKYPSTNGASMPWYSIVSNNYGIYVGNHDYFQETKVINLQFDKNKKTFSTNISFPIFNNEFSIPDVVIKTFDGKWYQASKIYRSWYDENFTIVDPPAWIKECSGWFLAILKQQNKEVMWLYKDIDKLCDIAEQFNLSTIVLFGWATGGHDRYYPNYAPCNLLGGREKLEKAIVRAQNRGMKIILYANGKIIDTSTDFYTHYGYESIVLQENGEPQIQFYIKHKNTTPVIFTQACTGSDVWRRTMYNLALQAVSLGADGILYDQIGCMELEYCFSENHAHRPGLSDARNRLHMIQKAREIARNINSDFVVMTEGTNDAIIRGVDYHHGWGAGSSFESVSNRKGFPELFMYTFPELIKTQRNSNPVITKTDANFALIYGLRHEIESRYPGDVDYLLLGTLPTIDSYEHVKNPPNILKMNLLPANEAIEYVHSLIKFENEYSDFFRYGRFIDQEGINFEGKDIIVKGFLNDQIIGVVVWNQHLTEKRVFSVSVPGYQLVKAVDHQNFDVSSHSTVSANSIQLLLFEKDN